MFKFYFFPLHFCIFILQLVAVIAAGRTKACLELGKRTRIFSGLIKRKVSNGKFRRPTISVLPRSKSYSWRTKPRGDDEQSGN